MRRRQRRLVAQRFVGGRLVGGASSLAVAGLCALAGLGIGSGVAGASGASVSGHLLRYRDVNSPGAAPVILVVAQANDGRLALDGGGEFMVYDGTKTWECKNKTDCEAKRVPGVSFEKTAAVLLASYLQPYGKNTVYHYFVGEFVPAAPIVVDGIASTCKSAVSTLDHTSLTVCVAKHGGYLTSYTSSTQTTVLVSVKNQVPVSDLERP
jgi:hypothetical protein